MISFAVKQMNIIKKLYFRATASPQKHHRAWENFPLSHVLKGLDILAFPKIVRRQVKCAILHLQYSEVRWKTVPSSGYLKNKYNTKLGVTRCSFHMQKVP